MSSSENKARCRILATSLGLVLLGGFAARSAPGDDPEPRSVSPGCRVVEGAIVRGPTTERKLALVFTGHQFAEGGATILRALERHEARAAFFLTGDFLANPEFEPLVRKLVAEGHSLGPHSDAHLLYCEWNAAKTLKVTRVEFQRDLEANLAKIRRFTAERPRWFLPPYEHYNGRIAEWTRSLGMRLVNYTPGTRAAADYTEDDDPNFTTSEAIVASILDHEQCDPEGLRGFILLMHIGAGPGRSDSLAGRLDGLLETLRDRGYRFVQLDELLNPDGDL